jgi:hypothetical protein
MVLAFVGIVSLMMISIILLFVAERHAIHGENPMGYIGASILILFTAIITLIITIVWR